MKHHFAILLMAVSVALTAEAQPLVATQDSASWTWETVRIVMPDSTEIYLSGHPVGVRDMVQQMTGRYLSAVLEFGLIADTTYRGDRRITRYYRREDQ